MKIAARQSKGPAPFYKFGTLLFDLENDPAQERPLDDLRIERRMIAHLKRLMRHNDAPPEQFERLGLEP